MTIITTTVTTPTTTTKLIIPENKWITARINHHRFKRYYFQISYQMVDHSRIQVIKRGLSKTCRSIDALEECRLKVKKFWKRQKYLVDKLWRRKENNNACFVNLLLKSKLGDLPALYDFENDKYIVRSIDMNGQSSSEEYIGINIMTII